MKRNIICISVSLLLIGGYYVWTNRSQSNVRGAVYKSPTIINASTATTTSSAIEIKGAKRVTLFLTTNIPTAGFATTTFAVTVSGDDTNYTTYSKLIDNAATTNSQTVTRVASKAYDSTTTAAIVSLDLTNDTFSSFKVSATQTFGASGTLGGATVKSLIEF